MADRYTQMQNKQMDIGGRRCPCCNWYHGKFKYLCNKQARAKLKEEDRKYTDRLLRGEED